MTLNRDHTCADSAKHHLKLPTFLPFGAMRKCVLFLAFLLIFTPSSAAKKNEIGHRRPRNAPDCKPFYVFFETITLLLDFLRWIGWFLQALINIIYFVLNTVLVTSCEIISSVFDCLRHAIKLLEHLGHGIRVLFQVNYSFVSSVFTWLARFFQFTIFSIRYLMESIVCAFHSIFWGILSVMRSLTTSIPLGFRYAFDSAWSAQNATGLVLYQSYLGWKYIFQAPTSALITITTSITAVLECVLMTAWSTAVLITELLAATVSLMLRGIALVGDTLRASLASVWCQLLNFTNMLLYRLQDFVATLGQAFVGVLVSLSWFVTFLFLRMIQGFVGVFSAIGWTVTAIFYFVSNIFTFVGRHIASVLQKCLNGLHILITTVVPSSPGGLFTLSALLSSVVLILCCRFVFEVNVLPFAFEMLATSLQGAVALLETFQWPNFSLSKRSQRRAKHMNQTQTRKDDKEEEELRRQLERERDKNLCVVCQSEQKNILVIPCRHMCMCKSCSNELFRVQMYRHRSCPLCRTPIASVIEIYS